MSKIQEAFPNQGRKLFESEKPAVEAFRKKYEGNMITKEELAQVQEFQKAVGVRENPFPRRIDPVAVAVNAERKAVVDFLRESGQRAMADYVEAGLHHQSTSQEVYQ